MDNDRGLIKWRPFMDSHLIDNLKQMQNEELHEEMIILSDDQLNEFNQLVAEAQENKLLVHIRYYDSLTKQFNNVAGIIFAIKNGHLTIGTAKNKILISVDNIANVVTS